MLALTRARVFRDELHFSFYTGGHSRFHSSPETYAEIIRTYTRRRSLRKGKTLHAHLIVNGSARLTYLAAKLVSFYTECRQLTNARKLFDEIPQSNVRRWTVIVGAYSRCGFYREALDIFFEMRKEEGSTIISQFLIPSVLKACGHPNVVTWNTLIAGFAQKGDRVKVMELFNLMARNGIEPDVVSWTSVISGLVQNFQNEAAFATFRSMLTNGFCPSHATISGLLPACASSANVRRGKELHCYAAVIGVEDDIYVRSALVDMYAKSGFIHEAKLMFHRTPKKNTATWNSMIFGNANNGCSDEAIRLFTQMEKMEGDKVDHLTFTAVFTACSHAGMVELGQSLFVLMQRKYNIAPRMEHYACMVDLLGNAGRVKEAYEVIKSIPMEPDLFVWGALLGACRKHGDIELGDIAAQKLAKLEPRNTGNNVLMSSLHAEAGSWSTVARFKKMLNSKKMRFSGCSWIESG
ncbi:Pentatricopeptide repeat-containing protein At5g59600 [Linum grandiflorum]